MFSEALWLHLHVFSPFFKEGVGETFLAPYYITPEKYSFPRKGLTFEITNMASRCFFLELFAIEKLRNAEE